MGIFKKIKNYFKRKEILKNQLDHSIPNLFLYNPANKTIVFVNGSMPTHDKDSGSNRLKEIIIAFKEGNFNCVICTNNAFRDDKYIQYYIDLGIIVYVETNKFSNYFEFLKSIQKIDYIWHYSPDTFRENLNKIKKIAPHSKAIFDMVDIHFLRFKRAIELEPKRISLRKKYQKYFKIETILSKKADIVVAISENEKNIISNYVNKDNVIVVSNIHYPKIDKLKTNTFENREHLLFIGSQHAPNIDAIRFLNEEIMPIVWKQLPQLNVLIIGNVKDKITSVLDERIKLLGYIETVEPYFNSCKIMIAPLRYGAGVKGKIGQAFEYYLPVITTPIGVEGMQLMDNKNALIKENAMDFAQAIIELYSNKNLWNILQSNSENSLSSFSKENLYTVIKKYFK